MRYYVACFTASIYSALPIQNFYLFSVPSTLRFRDSLRPPFKQAEYVNKINRHSFPSVRPRYNPTDGSEHVYMDENNLQHSNHLNGYYNYLPPKESPSNSPTKARFIERGVPEGAASVSPQDSVQNSTSTNTSPTSIPHTNPKPLFYAMNVWKCRLRVKGNRNVFCVYKYYVALDKALFVKNL